MVKLKFHGHACWEIDDGVHRVLIDPFLTGNDLAKAGPDDFDELQAILVTHGHADHIGDAEAISKRTGAMVVSNFEIASYFNARGCNSHPMHVGGGREFPFGHVKWTVAHHGSSGPEGEPLGNPMGVVLTTGGKKIYHAGDTALFGDMKLIGEVYGPLDVALLPIGDNFTMGIDEAAIAAKFLGAAVTIPMHYNTFDVIQADDAEFVRKLEAQGNGVAVVQPGGTYEVA